MENTDDNWLEEKVFFVFQEELMLVEPKVVKVEPSIFEEEDPLDAYMYSIKDQYIE